MIARFPIVRITTYSDFARLIGFRFTGNRLLLAPRDPQRGRE